MDCGRVRIKKKREERMAACTVARYKGCAREGKTTREIDKDCRQDCSVEDLLVGIPARDKAPLSADAQSAPWQ